MASKTTSIPRFLLPQHGPLWRTTTTTTARTPALARPALQGELGHVKVRYASRLTTASATPPTPSAAKAPAPTPRAASTRAGTSARSAAAKAAAASAPTKPKPQPQPPAAEQQQQQRPKEPQRQQQQQQRRQAQADPSKPIVLEKPERFNPPSHGARLPRSTPKHYGGAPTADEVKAQRAQSYPGLPPPENTWSHWFINSRGVHLFITLGTLTGLAVYSFTASFRAGSPFADLVPPISELPRHPLQYLGVCVDVVRLHEQHVSAQTAEKRKRKADDLAKRNEYRKAHGLEPVSGLWGRRAEDKDAGEGKEQQEPSEAEPVGTAAAAAAVPAAAVPETGPDGKRKKFWGIF